MQVLCLLGSARPGGNSEWLARQAIAALPPQGVKVEMVALREQRIEPVADHRHDGGPWPEPDDDYPALLESLLRADALLVATPVYWFSMPGTLKNFFDRWSATLRNPAVNFREAMRGKPLYLILTHGEEPETTEPVVASFRHIARFMEMDFRQALVVRGNRPGEAAADPSALTRARSLLADLHGRG